MNTLSISDCVCLCVCVYTYMWLSCKQQQHPLTDNHKAALHACLYLNMSVITSAMWVAPVCHSCKRQEGSLKKTPVQRRALLALHLLLANHTPIHTHSHNISPSPLIPIFYPTNQLYRCAHMHLYTHYKHTYLISHSLSSLPHGY